jgi:hypothetical protein
LPFSRWLLRCPAYQQHASSRPVTKLISKAHKEQIIIVSQIKAPLVTQQILIPETRFLFLEYKRHHVRHCFCKNSKAIIIIDPLGKFFLNWYQSLKWTPILPSINVCVDLHLQASFWHQFVQSDGGWLGEGSSKASHQPHQVMIVSFPCMEIYS